MEQRGVLGYLIKGTAVPGSRPLLHSSCFEWTRFGDLQKPASNRVLTGIKIKASLGGITERRNRAKVSGAFPEHRNVGNRQSLDF